MIDWYPLAPPRPEAGPEGRSYTAPQARPSADPLQTSPGGSAAPYGAPTGGSAAPYTEYRPRTEAKGYTQDYICGVRLASKAQRVLSIVVDYLVLIVLPLYLVPKVFPFLPLPGFMLEVFSAEGFAILAALTAMFIEGGDSGRAGLGNHRSPGKLLTGIQAVRPVRVPTGTPGANEDHAILVAPGRMRGVARVFLHVLDVLFLAGVVFLLVNRYNRTIADALTHTVHVRVKGMNDKSLIPAPGEAVDGT